MYRPDHFEEIRPEVLRDLIRRHPLATLVVLGANGLEANHIPLYLSSATEGALGVLRGHVARANPVWRDIMLPNTNTNTEALAIFHGPQSYISPSWYVTKAETGKVVPTWNYAVVHAYGSLQVKDDPEWVREQIVALTRQQESGFAAPWSVADAPQEFTERLIRQVVGIEIPISRWVGKWKVSQNQPIRNRDSVIAQLEQQGRPGSDEMAELIRATCKDGREELP
ncbi:MAG: FMN-binding negative transcriptional regulator [Acidithiobacillus sp.]